MSKLIASIPIQLGSDTIRASIIEHYNPYETYYELTIPALGKDKAYSMYLEPYGDVYFYFLKSTPPDIRSYEAKISNMIFNYHLMEGLV